MEKVVKQRKLVLENGVLKWWKLQKSEREVCWNSQLSFEHIPYAYEEITAQREETAHAGILQNFANAFLPTTCHHFW